MSVSPSVPAAVADAFLRYRLRVQHSCGTVLRRVPEQLFEVSEWDGWVSRGYFAPAASDLWNAPVPFRLLISADLELWEGSYRPAGFWLGSERTPEDCRERIHVSFRDIYDGRPQVALSATLDRRTLSLLYDGDGLVIACSLTADNGAQEPVVARMGTEAMRLRPGARHRLTCKDVAYELCRAGSADVLTLRRCRGDLDLDRARFPSRIDREAFLADLFPEPLRADPMGALPELLYDPWKYQHPFSLLGVRWERLDAGSLTPGLP